MKRRKTYIVMAVLLAVLVLGIGYAAVSDIGKAFRKSSIEIFPEFIFFTGLASALLGVWALS